MKNVGKFFFVPMGGGRERQKALRKSRGGDGEGTGIRKMLMGILALLPPRRDPEMITGLHAHQINISLSSKSKSSGS